MPMTTDDSTPSTVARLFTWRTAVVESDLTSSEKHVAVTLALYMNEMGGSAYPGAPRLAMNTSLSERTVRSMLKSLVDKGWLKIVEKGGIQGSKRRANEYVAVTPAAVAGLDASSPCNPGPAPLQLTTPTPAARSPHYSKNSSGSRAPDAADDMLAARRQEHERNAEAMAEERDVLPREEQAALARKVREEHAARRRGKAPDAADP